MVVDTVSNVENGRIHVRILNIGVEDIWIQPKTQIGTGTLHHTEILKSSDQEYTVDIEPTEINICRVSVLINTITSKNSELTSKLEPGKFPFTSKQEEKLNELFSEHSDVFAKNDEDVGYTTTVSHPITLTDNQPVKIPHRRIPRNQISEVNYI